MENKLNELYYFDEQGQLVINFDSLELITSQKFVRIVKEIIGDSCIKNFDFKETKAIFELYVHVDYGIKQFVYSRNFGSIDWTYLPLSVLRDFGFIKNEKVVDLYER